MFQFTICSPRSQEENAGLEQFVGCVFYKIFVPAAPPRGRPGGPPYPVAAARKKEDTRAKRPGCRGVVAPPVKERPFQGRNLHALSDDISEECYMHPVPPDGW
jgi:hypothetical protein